MTDLEMLQKKYDDCTQDLAGTTDSVKRIVLQKELARLTRIIDASKDLASLDTIIVDTKDQLKHTDDAEMMDLFKQELEDLEKKRTIKEKFLEDLTIPRDEHDERSVFIEIRAGAGGQEAALFAADLLRMYTNYALYKMCRWSETRRGLAFIELENKVAKFLKIPKR